MTFQINYSERIFKFLTIVLFLVSLACSAQAQSFNPNNLSNVRIDELSDEQVLLIIKQGQDAGLTLEQSQALAANKGLPPIELQKLKERLAKLQTNIEANKTTENVAETEIAAKNIIKAEKNDLVTGKIDDAMSPGKGAKITVFGQEYFRNNDIKIFDKSTDAKAPLNYVIGIGDELGISVFGYSFYNEVLKVDSRGAINPSQMGPIFVKGLTFEKAKVLIRTKMNQYFDLNNNKLDITLAYSRSITVNIVGEVLNPGSYNLPATNTAFNALILSGGPNNIGTLRNIKIKRNGKIIKTLDFYAFLKNSKDNQDFFLEDNDYIIVGNIGKLAHVVGEVNRPSTFELLDNENLNTLIDFAGGLTQNAYKDYIQVKRKLPKETIIYDLNYDSILTKKKEFNLINGDTVKIKTRGNELLKMFSVGGAVNFPGQYDYTTKYKITDLIRKAGGLKIDANKETAYIVRLNEDQTKSYIKVNLFEVLRDTNSTSNFQLKPLDHLMIFSNKVFVNELDIEIFGAVKRPDRFKYISNMTLGDAILQAGGLTIEAENLRIEISRLNYFSQNYKDGDDVKVTIEKVQLRSSNFLDMSDTSFKYQLQPFDQIFVRTVPNFEKNRLVELTGEVKYPGIYALKTKDEKLTSVIQRAGGLTKYAFVEASTFYRPTLAGNYVVLKLDKAMKDKNSKYNYTLKEGDRIYIPTVTDFVSIRGSSVEYLTIVNNEQVNAPYVKGRRANYYINKFGNGFSRDSWRRKTYVIQPNTKINRTVNILGLKIYPKVTKGSTIYVVNKQPKKERKQKDGTSQFDVNKFIESTTTKITGLVTLYIIFRQLN